MLVDIKVKFERYRHLIDELSKKQGKLVELNISGDKVRVDSEKYAEFINVSIHIFRNMVDHGIETQSDRIKTQNQVGKVDVLFRSNNNEFILEIKDDGRGIDTENIKSKVLEKD